jgi:cyclase
MAVKKFSGTQKDRRGTVAPETTAPTTQGTLNVIPLTHDVYACIGVSGGSNSGFIIGRRGVLVIDTRLNPPMARELRAAIRSVTDKPVTHVVNTHFHGDHTFGNQVFAGSAEIIASTMTRTKLTTEGELHREWLSGYFRVDYSEVEITPPGTVFDGSVTIDLGDRNVELTQTAAGHTGGDVMVWMPDAKVLFTGDVLVVNNIPWLGDSPGSARLMKDLIDLTSGPAETFVPGHGLDVTAVRREKIYSALGFLADVREQVTRLADEGASLNEVISRLDLSGYRDWRNAGNKEWVAGTIARLYQEIAGESH